MVRRPLDGVRRITGDTASHATYGVGPATDYGADTGEPVFAPFAGWVTHWWSNTGGWSVAVTDSVWKCTLQHNSGYRGPSNGQVAEGVNIAVVGSSGSATSGPHVHAWVERVNGSERMSVEDWLRLYRGFSNTAQKGGTVPGPQQTSTAGGKTTLFPEELEEETMYIVEDVKEGKGKFLVTAQGVGGATAALASAVNRTTRQPENAAVPLFYSEIVALDASLRAIARENNSAAAIDVDALAAQIAPLIAVSSGPTAEQIAKAVRSTIIKE
jgi:hypothetical protein